MNSISSQSNKRLTNIGEEKSSSSQDNDSSDEVYKKQSTHIKRSNNSSVVKTLTFTSTEYKP